MKLIAIVTNRITGTTHAFENGKTLCGNTPYPEEIKKVSYSGLSNVTCKKCLKKIPEGIYQE